MHARHLSLALVLAAGGALASGQTPKEDDSSELMRLLNTPIESASKRVQLAIESPQAVEVITADQIRASGAFRLLDVLRLATSVQVWDEDGDRANLTIRGVSPSGNPRTVQILVDGVPLFNLMAAPIDLNGLPVPTDAIERVEIVRGPSSSLFGANAQMGVISIITKQAGDGLAGSLRAGAADHGAFRNEGFISYGKDSFSLTASGAGFSNQSLGTPLAVLDNPAGSIPFKDAQHGSQAFLRPELNLGPASKLWFSYGYGNSGHYDQLSVNPATLAQLAEFPGEYVSRQILQAGWIQTWSPAFKTDVRLNQKTFNLGMEALATVPGSPASAPTVAALLSVDPALGTAHAFYHDQVRTVQVQGNWDPSQAFHVVGGVDASTIDTGANLTIGLAQAQTFHAAGGFVSLDWKVGPVNLSGGARLANESLGGSSTSPRFSAVWSLDDTSVLRAGYFTSTRNPMAQERYESILGNPLVGYNIIPNAALQPEKAEDYEVGFRKTFDKWSLDATFFHTTLKGLIAQAPTGQVTAGKVDDAYLNVASDYTDTGFEFSLTGELAQGVLVGLNASSANFKDPVYGQDQQADFSPQSQANAWIRCRQGIFFGYFAFQQVGAYSVAVPVGGAVARQTIDAYTQGHFNVGLEPLKNLSVSLYGVNAFRSAQQVSNISIVSATGIRYTRRELGLQATYRF